MAEPILMPRLTIDMEKGTVLEWKKEEGEAVSRGEIVAIVFGDKVEWEVESPADGVLLKVLVAVDEEMAVARPMAWVGASGEPVPEDMPESAPAPQAAPAPDGKTPGASAPEPARPGKPKASPAAKRIAREKGIDLSSVQGTGPGGRIVEADVLASETGTATPDAGAPVTLTPLRRTIADRMLRSWQKVPHFTLETVVDMSRAADFRESTRSGGKARFTWNDLVVSAVGIALGESQAMRCRWEGETLKSLPDSAVGVAVDTDQGLMVPVLPSVATRALTDLAGAIRDLSARARSGALRPADLSPACTTVTNLGMFGVTRFVPVLNHPECSILAVGSVENAAVVEPGRISVAPRCALNLAVDHRAIDGGLAARFLARIREILETGSWAKP